MQLNGQFKETPLGAIPIDWDTKTIGETFTLINGCAFKPSDWKQSGLPIIRIQNLNDPEAEFNYSQLPAAEKNIVEPDDLLFAWSGTIGSSFGARLWPGPRGVLNQHIFKVLMDTSKMSKSFALLVFARVEQDIAREAHGFKASFVHVKKSDLQKVNLPIPPLAEQRIIATALSDVDAMITGLERLIAKKRDIKQAAMQQLLTGQTRLPGFSGEWREYSLGQIAHIKTGSRNNEDKVEDGTYPFFVRSANVERINTYSHECEAILVPGEGQIGSIFHYINGRFDVHQRVYAITQFRDDISGRFVHLFMSQHFGTWAMQNTVKATVDSLRLPTFQTFMMQVPPTLDEQTAIATVLSDMDADLTALESRLAKTRAIKQGMMQELLTGRTRLVDSVQQSHAQESEPTGERKANVYFMRSVLAAEIVDQLHQEPTFGHVKFEKMMFLTEHLCHVDTGSQYARKAAGPLDRKALHSIDSQLKKQKWFDVRKENGRYRYVPLEKRGGHKDYFDRYFAPISAQLSSIVETFRTWDTERCEIVATLYAAWNDLLRENDAVSDDMIVHEVLHNWHESKQRIPEDRWLKALGWMRDKGYVPGRATGTSHD